MSITNGYLTLNEFKTSLGITSTNYDNFIEECIETASRDVDAYCGRRFFLDANATARQYMPEDLVTLHIDDVSSTSGFIVQYGYDGVNWTTVTSSQYELFPNNQVGPNGQTGWPITDIMLVQLWWPLPRYMWARRSTAQVTAKWGWLAVPTPVKTATRRLAQLQYEAPKAPFGAAGIGDLGIVRIQNDRIASRLLTPFVVNVPAIA